ncbi:hypothetical protein [Heyndrickxia sporothermodurans]|uniref:hypothetical protein n=1 Tax=Heyndrickxia sporothermodurans TaxID=46224 RepID=UPI00192B9649|nr:hypothetical protein [Heyndrickxia sporothermodurans]MBL5794418.1 hypothetical protein [Heyndrickxia sporothermodurans]
MRCLNGGLLVNYHYTRFGEVLLFLSLKPLDTQGLRIMKFIHLIIFNIFIVLKNAIATDPFKILCKLTTPSRGT